MIIILSSRCYSNRIRYKRLWGITGGPAEKSKSVDSGARLLEFISWFYHLLAVWPWSNSNLPGHNLSGPFIFFKSMR